MTRRLLVGCVTALVLASGALGRQVLAAPQGTSGLPSLSSDAEIREILAERVDVQRRNVGIVVGIVTPVGRRVIPYGRFSRDDSQPLTGDTVFEIGSVTKVFTSALLADMARRGEVKLTDPVAKYLPASITVGSNNGRAITLADLATHTSGLPFWPSNVPATREGALSMATYSEAQLFQFRSGFQVPDSIGSKWAYSNVDAALLGLALARRADGTYESLLKARVTDPLRLNSTAVAVSSEMKARVAAGYDAELRAAPAWEVPTLAGAGGLHSSTNDLLTFLAALDGDRSPLEGVLTTMLETRRPGPGIPQALGWWIVATGPGDGGIVTHDGGTLGFASAIAYDPKTRTGVAVLSNTVNGVGDIARHLLRPVIPLTKPAGAAPQKTEITVDPALLDRYAGRYEPAPGVAFIVSREGDALMVELPGVPKLRLRPESERAFFVAENTRVTVTFEADSDGKIARLVLRSPDGETRAARVQGR
jgi:CubicO group peptidase (beta-lactamase class C family)